LWQNRGFSVSVGRYLAKINHSLGPGDDDQGLHRLDVADRPYPIHDGWPPPLDEKAPGTPPYPTLFACTRIKVDGTHIVMQQFQCIIGDE
jgi:hypothetical protein